MRKGTVAVVVTSYYLENMEETNGEFKRYTERNI